MSAREKLLALRARCKGSRAKTYTNAYRAAWKAAAMDDSAAAAGSADVPAPVARAEGAGGDEADTEESSSDSDLPDTTAPAAAKAEERAGAADAARPERSAAGDDIDMGDAMSEAAASDPSLTIGELVDKTHEKLQFMAGYMEGASRMVPAESIETARAGAEHRRVLEHAQRLLERSEEFLEEQDAEAGAAASGAPPSGSAALDQDERILGDIDAFMAKAEAKDEPMADASKEVRSTSEEMIPDDPESLYYRAHKSASRVPRRFKAAAYVSLPTGIMAAMTEEAPDMPDPGPDGAFECPDCDVKSDSAVRWHLRRAACHNVPLSKAIFPPPSAMDSYRQDFRGAWFRLSREGLFFEMTEVHKARATRSLDVVLPLLVKGDKIRLNDGTCLRYGEGFEEESEPEADPAPPMEAHGSLAARRCATTLMSRSRSASSVSAALARARRSFPLSRSLGRVAATRCPRSRSLVALRPGRLLGPGLRLAPLGWSTRRRRRPRPEAPHRPSRRGTSRFRSIGRSSIDGAVGSATFAAESTRRSQTTASTNRLAARSRAPGAGARGRPVNGAPTRTSSRGPLRRSGERRGLRRVSEITRRTSRTATAARMTISRRSSPRVWRRSQSGRRPRWSGSARPWLPSELRSRSAVGSVQDATAGI